MSPVNVFLLHFYVIFYTKGTILLGEKIPAGTSQKQCVRKQLSNLCWLDVPKSILLALHLLEEVTLTPANQPMYPCYFLFLFPVIFSHDFAKTSGECFPTTTIRYMTCSYLHPFCMLSFHFLDNVLWCTKFWWSSNIFSFVACALCGLSMWDHGYLLCFHLNFIILTHI